MSDTQQVYAHPEPDSRLRLNFSKAWDYRQLDSSSRAVCILGTHFDPVDGPSPRMLSRLVHARDLIKRASDQVCAIAAGGTQGTLGHACTEAQLIAAYFRVRGFSRFYCEDFSRETIGNVVFLALGLLKPLRITEITLVTDVCHSRRVRVVAQHLLAPHVIVNVDSAPWPLSESEKIREDAAEERGMTFIQRFIDEVSTGDLEGAFDWVSYNHRSHPYSGWRLNEVVAAIQGQVLEYGLVLQGQGAEELASAF